MTYYELIFWICIIFPLGVGIVVDLSDEMFAGTFLLPIVYIMLGGIISIIVKSTAEFKMTSEVPVSIVSKVMIDDSLIILTNKGERLEYSSFKDINRINKGDPLIKRYYFKKVNFGFDEDKSQVEFK